MISMPPSNGSPVSRSPSLMCCAAASPRTPFFVDWCAVPDQDRPSEEWLLDQILARGGHSVYAAQKTGKSLLMLWAAAKLATGTDPVAVAYLDYEMTSDDLYERLADLGTDLTTTSSGSGMRSCRACRRSTRPTGPECFSASSTRSKRNDPTTTSRSSSTRQARAVIGDENSADTILVGSTATPASRSSNAD